MATEIKKTKHHLPSSLLHFLFGNLVIGLNLGFKKCLKKEMRPLVTIIQLLEVIAITVFVVKPALDSLEAIFYNIAAVQYVITVIIMNFTKYNLFDLIQDIHGIDGNIMAAVENKVGITANVWSLFFIAIKSGICVFHCFSKIGNCYNYWLPGYIPCILSLVVDGIVVIQVCVYYYIYKSIKYLNKYLEGPKTDLQYVINYYISLSECYSKIMPLYGKMVFVEIISTMPKLLAVLWSIVFGLTKQHDDVGFVVILIFISSHLVLKFCIPAITAEMSNSEMEGVKRKLHDIRVLSKDLKKQKDIASLLHYMETRNLQHRVCYVLPVDMRLIVSMFSVCTTYFIVILQFTHLL